MRALSLSLLLIFPRVWIRKPPLSLANIMRTTADLLYRALTRPGRFDKVIAVPLPDIRGRVQILQHHMRDITISKDADPTVLARGTSGFSGADLHNMVK